MADQTENATIAFDLTSEERNEIATKAATRAREPGARPRHGFSIKTDLKAGVTAALACGFSAHNHLFDENFDPDFGETEAMAG